MKIHRRDLLFGTALSYVAATRTFGQNSSAVPPGTQPNISPAVTRLMAALQRNRLPMTMGDAPAGAGWDWLVREAKSSRFTLIGEEHGVAETAQFSSALFTALRGSGYNRFAVELSPPIAEALEVAARRNGLKGIVDVLTDPGAFTFYNLREEAKFLADVIAAGPRNERVLWGLSREIFSDRYLISRLEGRAPRGTLEPLNRLKQASADSWARFGQTRNPDDMFILAQEPALVSAVRAAWPRPDPESDTILRTLEESLAIETAERTGGRWPYMERRTQFTRDNLAAMIRADLARKSSPKILMKFGLNHMIRGANYVNLFDIGAMADEAAALSGDRAFHILVIPSPGSRQAVPGQGRSFGSVATDDYDDLGAGDGRLTRVLPNTNATGHEVIDLRLLRPLAMRGLESWNSDVVKTIFGYDAAVIWKGARASTSLE